MRVAGIDCGTNSARLLIADVPGNCGVLDDVVRRMEVVRLGAGVDRTGRFDPAALDRTLTIIAEYAEQCRSHGVESIRFAATSATRDATNRDIFIDGVRALLGIEPQVLSGEEEARASFSGAISVLPPQTASPMLAVDLGGGSTELVLGTSDGEIRGAFSMNVGCVRMRERHLAGDPLTEQQIQRARQDVRNALDEAEQHVDLSAARAVIGLAGTVTTLTAKSLDLPAYQPEKIHGTRMSIDQIDAVCDWFLASTTEERAALPFMHPGRVDVIHSGALVWQEVIHRIAERTEQAGHPVQETVTSEHDILDGLALWAAREPQQPKL